MTQSTANRIFEEFFPEPPSTSSNSELIQQEIGEKTGISKADYDHIIRIVNIFGLAYKKYATNLIPSGQTSGKVSQRTFQQYEYIGKSEEPPEWDPAKGPGKGPWAYRKPYEAWQKGVMEILEDPQIRRVLANTYFVSTPEVQTDTEQQKPKGKKAYSSGLTLASFIEELLNGRGNFRSIRSKLLKKYLNIGEDDKDSYSSSDGGGTSTTARRPGQLERPLKWKDITANPNFEVGKSYRITYDWVDGKGCGVSRNRSSAVKDMLTFFVIAEQGNKLVIVANRQKGSSPKPTNARALFNLGIGEETIMDEDTNGSHYLCVVNEEIKGKVIKMVKDNLWCETHDSSKIRDGFNSLDDQTPADDPFGSRKITDVSKYEVLVNKNDEQIKLQNIKLTDFKGVNNANGNNSYLNDIKRI